MMPLARLAFHSSQLPDAVRLQLLDSLRTRKVNHKFHYDSLKQTRKWLALHEAYSPARTDPAGAMIYQRSFAALNKLLPSGQVCVIGLGCGGGQKDTALLQLLVESGRKASYAPVDVSSPMVLVARQTALRVLPEKSCFPLVCDLATAEDLSSVWPELLGPHADMARVLTFFGLIPNFEPEVILPKLANLVRPGDYLLLSANLAPGNDYQAGVDRVLPLYDNALTRDWLMTFLLDLGVELKDGDLRFIIEAPDPGLGVKRIAAGFHFVRERRIEVESHQFEFQAGESLRMFFSYRHTPALVRQLLAPHGLQVMDEWITPSQEEGVFLVSSTANGR